MDFAKYIIKHWEVNKNIIKIACPENVKIALHTTIVINITIINYISTSLLTVLACFFILRPQHIKHFTQAKQIRISTFISTAKISNIYINDENVFKQQSFNIKLLISECKILRFTFSLSKKLL